jgi:RNA polymerase sigma-70 factor (sigma-E family)
VKADSDLAQFVQAQYAVLLRTAFLLTGSAHEAEDLVQASLLKAMRHWRRIDEPLPYVRRIMANLHVSRWRRHRAREVLSSIVPDRHERDATDGVADREALLAALRRLPPRTRAVIVLRYWVDLSEADTADVLGCTVGTVKSTASRGLARLRDAMGPQAAIRPASEPDHQPIRGTSR